MNFSDSGSEGIERSEDVSSDVGKTPGCTPENVSKLTPHKYRQTYRIEWESMPDFKGWLKGVPGEPNRAYCLYCDKSLHAHCLSLLKHTCTIKHTKAAQEASAKKINADDKIGIILAAKNEEAPDEYEAIHEEDDEDEDDVDEIPQAETYANSKLNNTDIIHPPKKVLRLEPEAATQLKKCGISTHVLDTMKGSPVSGLQVSLYKLIDSRWTILNEGFTNQDGRYSSLNQSNDFTPGRYKLHFDVDRYFELRLQESLFPFVEIAFDVKSPQEHYHVPLLLSPFGYTTYKGS